MPTREDVRPGVPAAPCKCPGARGVPTIACPFAPPGLEGLTGEPRFPLDGVTGVPGPLLPAGEPRGVPICRMCAGVPMADAEADSSYRSRRARVES